MPQDVILSAATTTAVTMTLVDSNGTLWTGAKVIVTFVAPPNNAGPFLWNGAMFQMYYYLDNIGSTGKFTINLQGNLDITPSGSLWRFDIAPDASDSRSVNLVVQVSGTTMDLSQGFTSATSRIIKSPVQSTPIPRALGDADMTPTPNDGQMYFDTTLQVFKAWYNERWNPITSGGTGGGGCTGGATQILWLPSANVCAGDPLFTELGNSLNGGLKYTGNGANFDAENSGSYTFTANDPATLNGAALAQFNLASGGVNGATFGVRCDTSSGTGSQTNSGNINLYTTGSSTNGNNIFLTAVANPQKGGSGNITLEGYGALLFKADGSNITLQSNSGVIVRSGTQPTSFRGGIAPTTFAPTFSSSPYTIGSNGETTDLFNASGGNIIANVPATAVDGQIFILKKMDSSTNTVSITAAAGIIDGLIHYVLSTLFQSVTIQFDNPTGNWNIIAKV